ncbi:hypothetical protein GCM10022252_18710 [Streptosporangium oxazolinicum]|uniref:Uncharacterized protein n=1 Tax=Streptosporangium oxazolinicum TaxID=909287 RepID=A0ABP8AMX4_9ACTN
MTPPAAVLRELGLHPGDPVDIAEEGGPQGHRGREDARGVPREKENLVFVVDDVSSSPLMSSLLETMFDVSCGRGAPTRAW